MSKSYTETRMEHQWMSGRVRYIAPNGSTKGMTIDYYNHLNEIQDGRCKCCGSGQSIPLEANWNLNTGLLRGLVCSKCKYLLTKETNTLQWPDDLRLIESIANKTKDPRYIMAIEFIKNNP